MEGRKCGFKPCLGLHPSNMELPPASSKVPNSSEHQSLPNPQTQPITLGLLSLTYRCLSGAGSQTKTPLFILSEYGVNPRFLPSPGQVAQLVIASSPYAEGGGLILGQGTYKNQTMNTSISGITKQCFSLSLPLSLSNQQILIKLKKKISA